MAWTMTVAGQRSSRQFIEMWRTGLVTSTVRRCALAILTCHWVASTTVSNMRSGQHLASGPPAGISRGGPVVSPAYGADRASVAGPNLQFLIAFGTSSTRSIRSRTAEFWRDPPRFGDLLGRTTTYRVPQGPDLVLSDEPEHRWRSGGPAASGWSRNAHPKPAAGRSSRSARTSNPGRVWRVRNEPPGTRQHHPPTDDTCAKRCTVHNERDREGAAEW